MTALTRAKVALAVVGLAVWVWGVRGDDGRLRVVGIALLAVAFLLRLLNRRLGR